MYSKLFACAVLVLVAVLLVPYLAMAQDTGTQVSLDPLIDSLYPYVLTIVGAIIAAATAWITKKINEWTGISIEARHREALQSALMNGARYIAAEHKPTGVSIDLKNRHLAAGVRFVRDSVPDAVKHFGLTTEDIEKHLIPKISQLVAESK